MCTDNDVALVAMRCEQLSACRLQRSSVLQPDTRNPDRDRQKPAKNGIKYTKLELKYGTCARMRIRVDNLSNLSQL